MATIAEALQAALSHLTAGRRDAARELLGRILAAAPDDANAQHLLGLTESQDGDHAAAARRLRCAVALTPAAANYGENLARALLAAGTDQAATARAVRRARRLAPLDPEWPLYDGLLAMQTGETAAAAAAWRHLLLLQPDFADAWRNLGIAAHGLDRQAVAQTALARFTRLRPGETEGWVSLGAAARANDDNQTAAAAFATALALDPARTATLSTLGNTLKDMGRLAPALRWHDRADRASGGDPTIRWNHAIALLLAGDYGAGWPALESRWRAQGFPTRPRAMAPPLWRGEDPAGRRILVYEEQGRGDVIQFIRYVPLLAARGARVFVEVPGELAALLRDGLDGVAEVIVSGAPLPACDYGCPVMSLPLAFATTLATVPAQVPYLRADPARAAAWRARLTGDAPAGTLKIGLVAGGNPAFAADRHRSPGLARLTRLLSLPGIRWYGLSPGSGAAGATNYCDLGPEIGDFADTAAIMVNLDLVISSCTAAVHLAGALGRPVWALLAHSADWRWLTGRRDSPWYPTARLFRQPRPGDWDAVVDDVIQEMARLPARP